MLGTPVEAGGGIGMERLTEKISNGTKPKTLRGLIRWFVTHNGIRKDVIIGEYNKLYDRLVEYEDLGITPEQVRQMDAEFTRASKELADYKKSVDQEENFTVKKRVMGTEFYSMTIKGFIIIAMI